MSWLVIGPIERRRATTKKVTWQLSQWVTKCCFFVFVSSSFFFSARFYATKSSIGKFSLLVVIYFFIFFWVFQFQAVWFLFFFSCIVLSGILNSNRKNHSSLQMSTEFDSLNRIEYQVSNIPIIVHDSLLRLASISRKHIPTHYQNRWLTSVQIDFRKFVFKLGDA